MSDYPIKWHKTSHGYGKDGGKIRERESYVLITEHGAIEGWRAPGRAGEHYGGIEVHSKSQLYDFMPDPWPGHCEWTKGPCWHDGSSLAFDQIEYAFDNPEYMFAVLQEWADSHLNGRKADNDA